MHELYVCLKCPNVVAAEVLRFGSFAAVLAKQRKDGEYLEMVSITEKLGALGPRPGPHAVEQARQALAVIDAHLSSQVQSIFLYSHSDNTDDSKQRDLEIAKIQDAGEQEKLPYKTVLWLDQLYQSYEMMMKNGENRECLETAIDAKKAANRNSDGLLNLSGLQLTRLASDPSKLCLLVTLDLSKNNLEVLPDYFEQFSKLKVLNVSGNMLRSLPDSLGRCSSLVELDASFNQLEYLSSNFCNNLPNLQRLFLQLNKLSALPPTLCSLKSLIHLEVQFNKLVTLPVSIGDLKNLKTLNASGNFSNLTALPESIGYASSLDVLDLSYNQITRLPLSFGHLTQLRELRLLQNPLIFPPAHVVEHSTKAVVEYMAEQLRSSLALNEDTNRVTSTSLCKSLSPRGSFIRSSRLAELLGGLCRSTSLVLGGSAAKFVGLREDRSSDSDS